MRWLISFVLVLSGFLPLALGAEKTACRVLVSGKDVAPPPDYIPPMLGNGSLCMLVDNQGCQFQRAYAGMTPELCWAGRRYGPPQDQLIPFGHFEQELTCDGKTYPAPSSWTQSLNTSEAVVTCQCDYGDALAVETTVFIPLNHDLVVIKKKLTPKNQSVRSARLEFKYQFAPPGKAGQLPRRTVITPEWNAADGSVDVRYQVDGYQMYKGVLSILSDSTVTPRLTNQTFALAADIAFAAAQPVEITFYVLLADSLDGPDYLARSAQLKALIKTGGFTALLAAHKQEWAAYWAESCVHIPLERLERAYDTAQYHLRCNATKWSCPVGIFDTHWAGRYFGWDEMFCFLGLASSNHLVLSKRIPDFRHAGLRKALERTLSGARYPWETLEDGAEAAPPGFWHDHVFHMSNIALSSWFQYLYTGDLEYLKATGYPVIKGCATFFVQQMIYEDSDGSMFFGKCTDLERLGSARRNPFMTSCGAIFTLEVASVAAQLLKEDEGLAQSWRKTANKLRQSLPHNESQYVPYAGCPDASIAVLGGLFPYPVLGTNDVLQRNAVYEFVRHGVRYGNMYPVGQSVCAWYAGWMAAALAVLGDQTEAVKLLAQAAEGTGCFSEIFEIKEDKVVMHPWFATASGNFVYALNQVLLQCRDDRILIAPAVPAEWREFSFKLPCYGDLVAMVAVKDGRIAHLTLIPGDATKLQQRTLVIPERLFDERALNKKMVASMTTQAGCRLLDVQFKGTITLLETR